MKNIPIRDVRKWTHRPIKQTLRHIAGVTLGLFTCSFIVMPCALAANEVHNASKAEASHNLKHPKLHRIIPHPFPLTSALPNIGKHLVAGRQHAESSSSPTLLDEVGTLAHPVPAAEAVNWSNELKNGHASKARIALLHLWLGEWQLANNEQPENAIEHFATVTSLTKRTDPLHGLASYNTAIAHFDEGAYRQASRDFYRLLVPKTSLAGYNRNNCALWFRHAGACAGYHAMRAKQGIPEPPKLDPFCGAASLATCLRALHLPFDRQSVVNVCRITGRGSRLSDIVNAAKKLGASTQAVTADDQGLMALPKPLVAYVEHDHFVSLVRADKKGVSYLCSDCGMWPGGQVNLTWNQWHALEATIYLTVTKKGSADEAMLNDALSTHPNSPGVRVSASGPLASLHLSRKTFASFSLPALHQHVARYIAGGGAVCSFFFSSLHCRPGVYCCPDPGGPGPMHPHASGGPSEGEPVNLATGEEEYTPNPDLVVYNPHGPKITWQRIYNSLRNSDAPYGQNDFGIGWSDPYNMRIYDPALTSDNPIIPQGASAIMSFTGSDAPPSPHTNQYYDPQGNIANPGGPGQDYLGGGLYLIYATPWLGLGTNFELRTKLSGSSTSQFFNIGASSLLGSATAPTGLSATLGNGRVALQWNPVLGYAYYSLARSTSSSGPYTTIAGNSANFNYSDTGLTNGTTYYYKVAARNLDGSIGTYSSVVSATPTSGSGPANAQAPIGAISQFPFLGTHGATTMFSVWEVANPSGMIIATSASPAGWFYSAAGVYVPAGTSTGTGYEFRVSGESDYSSYFDVVTGSGSTLTGNALTGTAGSSAGTKYLLCPNGSRTSFTASAVPTSANPKVNCVVQAGEKTLIEWDYDASNPGGYYTVTNADRSQWIFRAPSRHWQYFAPTQIKDPSGNALNLSYSASQVANYPVLSQFTDASTGNALLTIARATSGSDAITSVTDAYGRSVYYQSTTIASTGQQELSQVSQVVPTGTSTPPAAWTYGYQTAYSYEGHNPAVSLHTITTPSPNGSNATATINVDFTNLVSSVVDANGNSHNYYSVPYTALLDGSNTTQVTVKNSSGQTIYSFTQWYDNNMSATAKTDGNGLIVSQSTFSDPYNPYRPSSVKTANAIYTVTPGASAQTFRAMGTDTPSGGYAWDIVSNGTVIDHSASGGSAGVNGYSVSAVYDSLTVSASSSVPYSSHYEVRSNTNGGAHASAFFDTAVVKGVTSYVWDSYGNLHQQTNPRGLVTNYTYAYPTAYVPSVVNSTSKSDAPIFGELQTEQEGSRTATTYTYYEPSGLVQSLAQPQPGTVGGAAVTTQFTYNSLGDIVTLTSPGNNATSAITTTCNYTTDTGYSQTAAVGQPVTMTDNLGKVTHFRYDARGNRTVTIDALGNETDYTYTLTDRSLGTSYPATGQSGSGHSLSVNTYLYQIGSSDPTLQYGPVVGESNYDESGTLIRQVNTTYGSEGETLTITGSTEPVAYTYDAAYRLLTLKDGGLNTTNYTYNTAGYKASVSSPGAGSATTGSDTINYTTYDANGNVLTQVDGRGVTTSFSYNDAESKVTNTHYTLPASPPSSLTSLADTSYTYDSYGRKSTATDAVGTYAYTYDDMDNQTGSQTSYSALTSATHPTTSLQYAYWPNGSRKTLKYGYYTLASPGTAVGTFSYNYDAVGRMNSLTDPSTQTYSWTYYDNNWLNTQAYSMGMTTTYTYNARGFMTDLASKVTSSAAVLSEFSSMVYDGIGNRTSMTANIPYNTSYNGTTTYQYDARNELKQESSTRNGSYTNNFAYDGVSSGTTTGSGNPTTFRSATVSGTYNSDNQISTDTYDGNGNPTMLHSHSASYDPENRLTSYNGVTSTYRADGQRASESIGTNPTFYLLYDGDQQILKLDTTGTLSGTTTWGPNGVLARRGATGGNNYYTYDPQGNEVLRLFGPTNIGFARLFDAFGKRADTGSIVDSTDGFGSQWNYWNDGNGLYLLGHRFYDSATGRFVTRDPIGYKGGINVYGYTMNNPINDTDPSGFWCLPQIPRVFGMYERS